MLWTQLVALVVAATAPASLSTAAPVVTPQTIGTWPHDPAAFTQGLVWHRGGFLESTGLYGQSSVRRVRLRDGRVLRIRRLPSRYFAEGLALAAGRAVQLTWREHTAFVRSPTTFRVLRRQTYRGEGWGLASMGRRLVMSDGTATLRVLDPTTFRVIRRVRVTDAGTPVALLNELEVVRGEIWANVWQTDDIVIINPRNGRVRVRLDLRGLKARLPAGGQVDVLNGIAWDRGRHRVYVTGKLWPRMFAIPDRPGVRSG
ncbi:MAG: glutaminyl-peptide cyclotransferase [Thermoleophilia bacterium]